MSFRPESVYVYKTPAGSRVERVGQVVVDISMSLGGASLAAQCIAAGLVDEIGIHLAPVLLGDGTALFEHLSSAQITLEIANVGNTPRATHLRYRVLKNSE
jgi:dihydrofolate reductase